MNRPKRRNALSGQFLTELTQAFQDVAGTDALGVILAANGPVFSAGHDFADVAGAAHSDVRSLLQTCADLMRTIQSVPQVVVARVHALATAAGCQLVATCDLAVAAESAGFAAPGGKGGWFCHTPMVPISHNIGRKRAMEMALTGDVIDARTAADWGLINYAVPDGELEKATAELLRRATQGSPRSKALGKQALYNQLDRPEQDAYLYAIEVMAASSQTPDAQEGMNAFLEKRQARF
jgi:enoyl-CoA hydratase/carnithine racemase